MTATLRGAKIASSGRSNLKTVLGGFATVGIRLLCHSSDGSCDRMCDLRFQRTTAALASQALEQCGHVYRSATFV